MASTIEIWIDTGEQSNYEDVIGWSELITFDWERYHLDRRYAEIVDAHVARTLVNLSKELALIEVYAGD
jgi:hypothetical protein